MILLILSTSTLQIFNLAILLKQRVFRYTPSQGAGAQDVTLTVIELRDEYLNLTLHIAEDMRLKRLLNGIAGSMIEA